MSLSLKNNQKKTREKTKPNTRTRRAQENYSVKRNDFLSNDTWLTCFSKRDLRLYIVCVSSDTFSAIRILRFTTFIIVEEP